MSISCFTLQKIGHFHKNIHKIKEVIWVKNNGNSRNRTTDPSYIRQSLNRQSCDDDLYMLQVWPFSKHKLYTPYQFS
jgi:hypothetical protein